MEAMGLCPHMCSVIYSRMCHVSVDFRLVTCQLRDNYALRTSGRTRSEETRCFKTREKTDRARLVWPS